MSITREEVLDILIHDLPGLLGEKPELRYALIGAMAETFARQEDLHAILEEIRALREDWGRDSKALWEEVRLLREDWTRDSKALWEEVRLLREDWARDSKALWGEVRALREDWARDSKALWGEVRALREDFNTYFAEHSRRLEEHSVAIRQLSERMEQHSVAIRELNQRMEEHSVAIRQLSERMEKHSEAIREMSVRLDGHSQAIRDLQASIGGLGARWGLMSEKAFRDGMAAILAEVGLQVERFWQIDTKGYVFGQPDQVEIDAAVHNGQVILVEIKSSISRGDVTIFQRKVELYEQVKGVKAARRIIVSPFVEPEAAKRARAMGIEVYTSGSEVTV